MAHAEEDRSTGLDAVADPAIGQATEAADLAHEREHAEACGLNHCGHGHATDVLAALRTRLDAGGDGAPLPTPQAWASQALPNNIERPKWDHTTPTVVNL